jgi:hypothetical protein
MVVHWRWAVLALGAAAAAAGQAHGSPPGKLVEETWESASVDGVKVGWAHTLVYERDGPEGKRLRAACELDLTFRRQASLLRLRVEQGTEETPAGRVLAVFMRQGQEGGPRLDLAGELEEGKMHVRVDGGRIERRLAWPEDVLGWYGREHFFQKHRPRPGDQLTWRCYEPTFNALVTLRLRVGQPEEVALPTGSRKLWRVDMTADPLVVPGHSVQPPGAVWWLDDDFVPVRKQLDLEGLGAVVLTRATRTAAQAQAPARQSVDIGLKALVPLDRALPRPYDTRSVVYRITLTGDADPGTALARDAHQEVRALDGQSFELHVHPPRSAQPRPSARPVPVANLAPCHYIDCDDARIKELARRAVGDETDPWRKARRIERWVKQAMRVDNAAGFVPASVTARELRGDCRHYALLTAALCRAAGMPARPVVGLLYVQKAGRPQLGFHMWTEVCIDGQWLGLDATLGRGGVSAAHLKIADDSWQDALSLTPLLPVHRVLGKIHVEVLRVEGDG